MTSHLGFVSHMSYQDTMLCHESLAFGHKGPASIFQQVTEKPLDPGFGQPMTAEPQKHGLHTPSLYVDKDSPPSCAGKDH